MWTLRTRHFNAGSAHEFNDSTRNRTAGSIEAVSDYGLLPTEDVRPRSWQGAGRDDDFYAERPRRQSSDLDASPKAAGNRGNGGFLDLVPEQYADQFRAFKEDPEFRDSSPLNSSGNLAMRESGRSPTTSEEPQQQPLPEPAAAPAPVRPARRGHGWQRVPGREVRATGSGKGHSCRDGHAGSSGERCHQWQERRSRGSAWFSSEPHLPAWGRSERGVSGGRAKPPVPGADPHESSESALGARFDEMEDDAEDLIPRKAPEQPVVPGSEVQSSESFLREQETRRAGLPVIPKDMTDFPGADILYQPQRRRAHL